MVLGVFRFNIVGERGEKRGITAAQIMSEHHGIAASLHALGGAVGVQVRTSGEIPLIVDVMREIEPGVFWRRLDDGVVNGGAGNGYPADYPRVHGLPVLPVDGGESIGVIYAEFSVGAGLDVRGSFVLGNEDYCCSDERCDANSRNEKGERCGKRTPPASTSALPSFCNVQSRIPSRVGGNCRASHHRGIWRGISLT